MLGTHLAIGFDLATNPFEPEVAVSSQSVYHEGMKIQDHPAGTAQTNRVGRLVYATRWLQAPIYIGLVAAQCVYVWQFLKELWHLVLHAGELGETGIMLAVLGLIDVAMIANLLLMVIVGGWETFVSRLRLHDHPDEPEWLSHVNAGVLKIKLAMALIGISSVHLLKTFINAQNIPWQTVAVQAGIHVVFLISALALAWTDRLISHKS